MTVRVSTLKGRKEGRKTVLHTAAFSFRKEERKDGRKEERPSFIQLPSPSGRKDERKTVLYTAALPLLSPCGRGPVRHRHIHVEEPTVTENCPGKIVYKLHQHRGFIGLGVIPKATPSTPELGPLAKCGFQYKH